jgi:hypothetical protein
VDTLVERLDAFAPAGGLRSTVDDVLTYLEAHLYPNLSGTALPATADSRTLATALVSSHELLADHELGLRVAFAWAYSPATESYWHGRHPRHTTLFLSCMELPE